MTTTQTKVDAGLTQTDFAQGIVTAFTAVNQIRSARLNAQQMQASADFAMQQSEAALTSGLAKASQAIGEGRRTVSLQRAQLAGSGVDVGVGTSLDLQDESEIVATENAKRTIQAATLRAYGFEAQANQQQLRASTERLAGLSRATGTILTSVGRFQERQATREIIANRGDK